MLVTATARMKYLSIPPRKMRLVANMVKGMPVEKALNVLNFTPRIAAHHLAKTVKSAAANALSIEGTDSLHPEDLVIKEIAVDNAPMAKRVRFQSMGRIFRIRKRFCHLTVKLEAEVEQEVTKKSSTRKARKAVKPDTKTIDANKKEIKTPTKRASVARTKKSVAAKKTDSKNESADE
ncbi:MAG: 50S ribosomal protein L22 [Candidatus Zixiibacteriota bacterium]|nr:MAG: 50S ribosomal protein L22 [candidate division Zixibacteria bacterium]